MKTEIEIQQDIVKILERISCLEKERKMGENARINHSISLLHAKIESLEEVLSGGDSG